MSHLLKYERPVKWFPAHALSVEWVEAQRPIKQRRVSKMVQEMDPDAFGVLTVAMLKDGSFHIIDGQHRHAAVVQLWGPNERVPCQVIEGCDTPQEAAELWLTMNIDRSKPSAYESFRVAVTAKKPDAVAVYDIVEASPYSIGYGGILAVGSLLACYRAHGAKGLEWVLDTINKTWGDSRDATQAGLIQGYTALYDAFGPDGIDAERLAKYVAKRHTPNAMIGAARTSREMFGGGIAINVARVAVADYNKHLKDVDHIRLDVP